MIGRSLFCAAALGALVTPGLGLAQVVHNYLPVATVTLPEVGDPKAVVFADVGSIRKTTGGADIDVIYALGDAHAFDGKETTHVDFQYAVACGPKTLQNKGYAPVGPTGPRTFVPLNEPAHPAADVIDQTVVALACEAPQAAPAGYATLDLAQAHTRAYLKSRAEQDSARRHVFVFVGAGPGAPPIGPFVVFVDAASLERSGDEVTAQILEIFEPPAQPVAHALAYAVNTTTYACTPKTQTSVFTALYQVDGVPLRNHLTGGAAKPVNPATIDERAMNLACTDGKSAKGSTALASIEAAQAIALKTFAANSLAAKPAATQPAPAPAR